MPFPPPHHFSCCFMVSFNVCECLFHLPIMFPASHSMFLPQFLCSFVSPSLIKSSSLRSNFVFDVTVRAPRIIVRGRPQYVGSPRTHWHSKSQFDLKITCKFRKACAVYRKQYSAHRHRVKHNLCRINELKSKQRPAQNTPDVISCRALRRYVLEVELEHFLPTSSRNRTSHDSLPR